MICFNILGETNNIWHLYFSFVTVVQK